MIKLKVSYENEKEKLMIIESLSRGNKILTIKPGNSKGKYKHCYIKMKGGI